nr:unnamed protein product [Digitaria exilis]
MENLSEVFLLLWKKETPEQEEDNREREEEQKKIRARWKPSEMKVHMEIMLLIKRKKMAELEELYTKKLARKKTGEKGVQAHNKLMAYYCKYAPDYLQFRDDWIARNPGLEFEDITTVRAMIYTNQAVPQYVYDRRSNSLQIYHIKIKDPYLALTGPSRAVGMNEPVTIEAELKVKGAVKSKDTYFILEAKTVPLNWGVGDVEFIGTRGSRLKISLGELHNCVEATLFLRVIGGTWPAGLQGHFAASTAESPKKKVLLIAFGGDGGESVRGDGNMTHLRHVISVEESGELIVSVQAWRDGQALVDQEVRFKAKLSGRSFGSLNVCSCHVGVLVAWSRIRPMCDDLVPEVSRRLCHS